MTTQRMSLADRAAVGHSVGWEKNRRRMDRGWLEIHKGFTVAMTGLPAPSFNGATLYGTLDPGELSDAMGRVAAAGVAFCLQSRPAVANVAAQLAWTLGMEREPSHPLMVTTEPPAVPSIDGLVLRRLAPEEGDTHAAITAEAFGAPFELMRTLSTPETIGGAGAHVIAGDWHDSTVATATADVNGEAVGIFDVATREAFRGRGFGSAVTAAAVQAGFEAGGRLAFLLASELGVGVYERLGFRQLEQWSIWVARRAV